MHWHWVTEEERGGGVHMREGGEGVAVIYIYTGIQRRGGRVL